MLDRGEGVSGGRGGGGRLGVCGGAVMVVVGRDGDGDCGGGRETAYGWGCDADGGC